MKRQLDFNIHTANYLEKGNNFIQRFASAYMFLEEVNNPAEIFYEPEIGGKCFGCSSGGEKHSCKKDKLAAKRCGFFFLFNTMCGNSAIRRRFDGTPTDMQKLTGEYDKYCGSDFTIDFLFGYTGYEYRKCTDPSAFKNEIVASINNGKPVIAKKANIGSYFLITGYDGDTLIIPPFVGYDYSVNPPAENWEQAPAYDEIEVLYIFGVKTTRLYTLIDGLNNIRRVMEYNLNEGLWDEYLSKLSGDELQKADPSERQVRVRHFAETNLYMYNFCSFEGAFSCEKLPDHYLHKELLAPELSELWSKIEKWDITDAGHKTGRLNQKKIWFIGTDEEDKTLAFNVGTWPLEAGTYDPGLDSNNIPDGAAVFGLFDQGYGIYPVPESIDGLTRVAALSDLKESCYFVLNASSGFGYVIVMTNNPERVEIELKNDLYALSAEACEAISTAKQSDIEVLGIINQAIDIIAYKRSQP